MARAPAVNKLPCFASSLLCFTWHFAKHWRDPRFPSALFGPHTKKPDDASASIGIVMR